MLEALPIIRPGRTKECLQGELKLDGAVMWINSIKNSSVVQDIARGCPTRYDF